MPICQVLTSADVKIAPSTYYAAKSRPVTLFVVAGEGVPVAGPAAVGTGVLPLSFDDPGGVVTHGGGRMVIAD